MVVRGDPAEKKFAVWYLKDGKALAVDAINDPASFAMGKRLITIGASIDAKKLGDVNVDLKSLA